VLDVVVGRQTVAPAQQDWSGGGDHGDDERQDARQSQQDIFGVAAALVDDELHAEGTERCDEDAVCGGEVVGADRGLPAGCRQPFADHGRAEHHDHHRHAPTQVAVGIKGDVARMCRHIT
jgi:hypothetical protein